jgi:hypothetical protein
MCSIVYIIGTRLGWNGERIMSDITTNDDQKLYVIPAGGGYSCLGYTYAYDTAVKVAQWCGCEPPREDLKGTEEGYADYLRVMSAGDAYNRRTHKRCFAGLVPELDGLEGCRVEVTRSDGSKYRFWVGMSTGWYPCHIEVLRRDSSGGCSAFIMEGDTVRIVNSDMGDRRRYAEKRRLES